MISLARWLVIEHGDVVLFVVAIVTGWVIAGFVTLLFLQLRNSD